MNKAYVILFVSIATAVGAQDGTDQTIEELFLGQQIELQIMRSQAIGLCETSTGVFKI